MFSVSQVLIFIAEIWQEHHCAKPTTHSAFKENDESWFIHINWIETWLTTPPHYILHWTSPLFTISPSYSGCGFNMFYLFFSFSFFCFFYTWGTKIGFNNIYIYIYNIYIIYIFFCFIFFPLNFVKYLDATQVTNATNIIYNVIVNILLTQCPPWLLASLVKTSKKG